LLLPYCFDVSAYDAIGDADLGEHIAHVGVTLEWREDDARSAVIADSPSNMPGHST
jgi:hypothetical protein